MGRGLLVTAKRSNRGSSQTSIGSMNGPVDSPATEQARIRGVDDDVGREAGDVALLGRQFRHESHSRPRDTRAEKIQSA